jgi:SAM-dependent methyltransferase
MAEQTTPVEAPSGGDGPIEYGAFYYRHDCGIPYERNEHWLGFFGDAADGIVRDFHPTSVLDAGCAMGFLVEALRNRGVDAWGLDVSEYAISKVHESAAEYCGVASLTEPLSRRYDLITCIEVLEHIPAAETDKVIANLCQATDRLLLSTSPEDYGEATHLNVQQPEVWSAILAREGFLRDLDHDLAYLTPWAALYKRVEEPLTDTVRRYDRSWWRLRREAFEVRRALLSAQERLTEIEEKEDQRAEETAAMRAATLLELDRRDEEILRLRDLIVGRDLELGVIRGRLAPLEDQSQRVTNATDRVQAKLPGIVRLADAVFRRLRKLRG